MISKKYIYKQLLADCTTFTINAEKQYRENVPLQICANEKKLVFCSDNQSNYNFKKYCCNEFYGFLLTRPKHLNAVSL